MPHRGLFAGGSAPSAQAAAPEKQETISDQVSKHQNAKDPPRSTCFGNRGSVVHQQNMDLDAVKRTPMMMMERIGIMTVIIAIIVIIMLQLNGSADCNQIMGRSAILATRRVSWNFGVLGIMRY